MYIIITWLIIVTKRFPYYRRIVRTSTTWHWSVPPAAFCFRRTLNKHLRLKDRKSNPAQSVCFTSRRDVSGLGTSTGSNVQLHTLVIASATRPSGNLRGNIPTYGGLRWRHATARTWRLRWRNKISLLNRFNGGKMTCMLNIFMF